MKIGDGAKPFGPLGGSQAKVGQVVDRGLGPLAGAAGKLGEETAGTVDRFEKAASPAFRALLGPAGTAGGAAAGATADAGAVLLGGLRAQIGRAEGDIRSLMRQVDGLRVVGTSESAPAGAAGGLGTALLDGLAAAADALARAQDLTAAEASLESMIGHAGRLLRGDTARDVEGMGRLLDGLQSAAGHGKASAKVGVAVAQWTAQKEAAAGQATLDELKQSLAGVENQIKLILGQIEEVRSAEAAEREAAEPAAADDSLAAAAQSVSDAWAAIRDLFD